MRFFYKLLFCSVLTFPFRIFSQEFAVDGVVRDLYTNRPMPSVNVFIQELQKGTLTDTAGYFKISALKKGYYTLVLTRVGYKRQNRKIQLFRDIHFPIKMEEQSILFEAQEITPGVTELSISEGSSSVVTSQEILSSPQVFSKDVYRSLQTVPGVANSEWSSKPYVKGGNPDETAVIIDNLEIREPFHLEEIDGPYSVISSDLVKNMKVITGGFSPKYSDRMSGVLSISTIDRIEDDSIKATADFSNASVALHQTLSDRLNVYFSGRRSYIFLLENAFNNDFPTTVYDIWTKADYKLDPNNRISANFMLLNDKIEYRKDSTFIRNEFFNSNKTNYYAWLNWYHTGGENRYFSTTLGYQDLVKKSDFSFDGSFTESNLDRRSTKLVTAKHDHLWKWRPGNAMEFGAEFNQFFSDYYYREFRLDPTETTPIAVSTDIIFVDSKFRGYTGAAYIQNTTSFNEKTDFIYGIRTSMQSYTDDIQISPRMGLSYDVSQDINLKFAYGWYYQPDNFQKLRTYDNQRIPERKPEKCIHYIASGAYKYDEQTHITMDVYYKDYTRLNDDFVFDFANRIEGVGLVDKPYQTAKGFATGMDLLVRRRYGVNNLLSVAYALGTSHIINERGTETYRDLDRTHVLSINNIYNYSSDWTMSSVFRIRSGDPYTPSDVQVLGDGTVSNSKVFYVTRLKNSRRLPVFHSLDLRIEKRWFSNPLTWVTYASVINALGHENVRQRTWKRHVNQDGTLAPYTLENQDYFPRFFSAGISLEFSLPRTR